MEAFFRPEVLLARQRGVPGRALAVRPLSATALTAFALAAVVGVGAWSTLGTRAHGVRIDGFLASGPAGGVQAELFADAAAARWLRVEQPLQFHLVGVPDGSTGRIVAVSAMPIDGVERAGLPPKVSARAGLEPLYRVVARIDAQGALPVALVPGEAVEANAQVARRRPIDWLLSRLGGASGVL